MTHVKRHSMRVVQSIGATMMIVLMMLVSGAGISAAAVDLVYWTDVLSIRRATYSGNEQAVVKSNPSYASEDIACDAANNVIFWSVRDGLNQAIWRADLDGANAVQILGTPDVSRPTGIDVAPSAERIYWVDSGTESIRSASYTGTDVTVVNATDVGLVPNDIEVDEVNDLIFWNDLDLDADAYRIMRATLSGTSAAEVYVQPWPPFIFGGLAIDPVSQQIYWMENPNITRIIRTTYTGANYTIINDTDLFSATDLEIDAGNNLLFWSDREYSVRTRIMRSTLEGTNPEVVYSTAEQLRMGIGLASAVTVSPAQIAVTHLGRFFEIGETTELGIEVQDSLGLLADTNNTTQVTFTPSLNGTITGVGVGIGDGVYGTPGGSETVTVSGGEAAVALTNAVAEAFVMSISDFGPLDDPPDEMIFAIDPNAPIVPSLGRWAFVLLASLLAGSAAWMIRRQRDGTPGAR